MLEKKVGKFTVVLNTAIQAATIYRTENESTIDETITVTDFNAIKSIRNALLDSALYGHYDNGTVGNGAYIEVSNPMWDEKAGVVGPHADLELLRISTRSSHTNKDGSLNGWYTLRCIDGQLSTHNRVRGRIMYKHMWLQNLVGLGNTALQLQGKNMLGYFQDWEERLTVSIEKSAAMRNKAVNAKADGGQLHKEARAVSQDKETVVETPELMVQVGDELISLNDVKEGVRLALTRDGKSMTTVRWDGGTYAKSLLSNVGENVVVKQI